MSSEFENDHHSDRQFHGCFVGVDETACERWKRLPNTSAQPLMRRQTDGRRPTVAVWWESRQSLPTARQTTATSRASGVEGWVWRLGRKMTSHSSVVWCADLRTDQRFWLAKQRP